MKEISRELKELLTVVEAAEIDDSEAVLKEIKEIYLADQDHRKDLLYGDYWLNAVCYGFVRYFDESGIEWRSNDTVLQAVQSLVSLAAINLITKGPAISTQRCGKHEDGACTMGPCIPGFSIPKKRNHKYGDSPLYPGDAQCFGASPSDIRLPKLSKIQRIIENPERKFESWSKFGPWWKCGHVLPAGKLEWRAGYAVLKMWNENGWYVNAHSDEDIPVWLGIAASQKVKWNDKTNNKINETCILKGGETQIYIDAQYYKKIFEDKFKKTPW